MNADPDVMEHFPEMLDRDETAKLIERIETQFEEQGFGFWALELVLGGEMIGYTGLNVPRFEAHFTPAVEVGWRLAKHHWGKGFASEAARAALDFGFDEAGLDEIVSFAVPANTRSIGVMERIGMTHDPADDFDHPRQPEESPLRRHVLYRMTAQRWAELNRR